MKTRLLAVLLALPLAAFDCGGKETPACLPGMFPVRMTGAVQEDLCCVASTNDWALSQGLHSEWLFTLVAYRGMDETNPLGAVAGNVAVRLPARPALRTQYGWGGTFAENVLWGSNADRWLETGATHEATATMDFIPSAGKLSIQFTRIPPAQPTQEQSIDVHGSFSATLEPVAGGAPVFFSGSF